METAWTKVNSWVWVTGVCTQTQKVEGRGKHTRKVEGRGRTESGKGVSLARYESVQ